MRGRTLIDLLLENHGEAGIRFITGEGLERVQSYTSIADDAARMLAALQARGLDAGAKIVVAVADPRAFVLSFWACILGGLVPVPVQPPANEEHRLKLARIMDALDQPFLIADAADTPFSAAPGDLLAAGLPPAPLVRHAGAEDLAFIQFSSGSTGDPKGVMLTHGQLVTHFEDFSASAQSTRDDVYLSWFPLTHDMGLIGWHLIPLAIGASQCLMPTKLFVQRPSLWLSKAVEHGATILCTNNFGIKHFLKLLRTETASRWDLSAIRQLFNAAEPISADLCQEFLTRLAPYGLKDNALFPGYGLAEAALGVAFAVPGESMRVHRLDRHRLGLGDQVRAASDPRDEVALVELGRPIQGVALRVVDAAGAVLGDRQIGSVELLSRTMARGYYRNDAANALLWAPDGWLRTGDAGFLDSGRLVLTGRIKDLIIQAGVNYYPQDLERLAEAVPGIELGRVVAVGILDPAAQRERLVLFVQSRQEAAAFLPIAQAVQATLLRKAGLLVDHVLPIRAVPKTTSGKIERYKLAQRFQDGEFAAAITALQALAPRDAAQHAWRQAAGPERRRLLLGLLRQGAEAVLDQDGIALDRSLFEQGLDSRRVVSLQAWLTDALGMALPVSLPFDRPTLIEIADFIEDQAAPATLALPPRAGGAEPIAIIGMGCRFPGGADRPAAFWDLLCRESDVTGPLPASRGAPADRVHGGFLEDVAGFDHGFFHLSPREAEALDPQARLLLEVAWEALEDAGQDIPALADTEIGVFAGITNSDYALAQMHSGDPAQIGPYAYSGASPSMAAGRIAHVLGLQGPAMAVDTACSSSLVALHLAAESLRAGDCTMALAAGVNLILAPAGHISLGQLGALSPTGTCRPFDDAADGYVRGEGCGVVVLKPLRAAQADGDRIHALLLSSAVNHDGRSAGLTVPSGPAQARVIRRALQRAGLTPDAIGYVEAHGTGTKLGDPVEMRALDSVFGPRTGARLPVGSVKGNIGHLEAAAGIAGIIKAVLALRHGTIPRSLHVASPNRHLTWDRLATRVAAGAEAWPPGAMPRRAGVSAFGFAGTNAHAVLQEAPAVPAAAAAPGAGLMPLSAASAEALRGGAARWADAAALVPDDGVALAAAAARRRGALPHRAALRFSDRNDLARLLAALAGGEPAEGLAMGRRRPDRVPRLGFVYSGQGAQWAGMGAALMQTEPVFRNAIAACDAIMTPLAGWSVTAALERPAAETLLARTDRAQAAIFAVQYALTVQLAYYGITPDCVVGHSCGEIAALAAAGVLTLEQACRVAIARGRHMQDAAADGVMMAVRAPLDRLAPLLSAEIELAAMNSPVSAVLATDRARGPALERELSAQALPWHRLDVAYAFHSGHMAAAADGLMAELADLAAVPAQIPIYSTALGRLLGPGEPDAGWWRANVRNPVRFVEAVDAMRRDETTHFLEVSPHPVLSHALAECLDGQIPEPKIIGTLRRGRGQSALHDALGALFVEGFDLRWDRLHPAPPPLADDLPLYAWQRTRLWPAGFDPWAAPNPPGAPDDAAHYAPVWHPVALDQGGLAPAVLILADQEDRYAAVLAQALGATLQTGVPAALPQGSARPSHVLLMLTPRGTDVATAQREALRRFLTVLRAITAGAGAVPALWLLTGHAQTAADGPGLDALWALARSAAAEYPEAAIRRVDLGANPGAMEAAGLARLLAAPGVMDAELALRGGAVQAARLERLQARPEVRAFRVHGGATYLVTGGCGTLGLMFARLLVARGARNLVLLGRTGSADSATIRALEAAGARVLVRPADVTNPAALTALMAEIGRDLPPLAGVVHAAGVLEDGIIAGLDPVEPLSGAFGRVLAPKLDGGWALHQALAGQALDFTVLLSSAAVVLGSPGQGAYAAANGFLDALAAWRSQSGLPTLSLRLGLVAGTAMAARMTGRDLAKSGVSALAEASLARALPALWSEGHDVATVMAFQAADWVAEHPSAAARAYLAPLLPHSGATLPVTTPAEAFGTGELALGALRNALRSIVAAVTRSPADGLADEAPFRELGVDSLMTLQIRDAIVGRVGITVPITDFWAHASIDAFARNLAARLNLLDAPVAPAPAPSVSDALADKWAKYL